MCLLSSLISILFFRSCLISHSEFRIRIYKTSFYDLKFERKGSHFVLWSTHVSISLDIQSTFNRPIASDSILFTFGLYHFQYELIEVAEQLDVREEKKLISLRLFVGKQHRRSNRIAIASFCRIVSFDSE